MSLIGVYPTFGNRPFFLILAPGSGQENQLSHSAFALGKGLLGKTDKRGDTPG